MSWLLRAIGMSCCVTAMTRCAGAQAVPRADSRILQVPETLSASNARSLTTGNQYVPLRAGESAVRVQPIAEPVRQRFGIPTFYTKGLMVRGIPILSSDKASDYALLECAYTLDHLFADSPSWVVSSLTTAGARMCVMSSREYTMDLPENLEWQDDRSLEKMAFWDERARGMGGLPDASCAEENLLNLSSDPYKRENITIHEFSHTVASALEKTHPEWYKRLVATYQDAMKAGRFAHTYSASNEQEYWAEGVQMWFDCAVEKADASVHNGIWNREQLKIYDAGLSRIVAEVFGDGSWRYIRTDGRPLRVNGQIYTRSLSDKKHLIGLNRSQIPAFNLADSPRIRALKANASTAGGKE